MDIFMGVTINPTSEINERGEWIASAILCEVDGLTPGVVMLGWPLEHATKEEADLAAIVTARRRIHRGQWREDSGPSDFQPLG